MRPSSGSRDACRWPRAKASFRRRSCRRRACRCSRSAPSSNDLEHALAEAEIRAPFDGVVAARFFDPGALTRGGRPILRVISSSIPRVRFAIPEPQSSAISVGGTVSVVVEGVKEPVRAEVESVVSRGRRGGAHDLRAGTLGGSTVAARPAALGPGRARQARRRRARDGESGRPAMSNAPQMDNLPRRGGRSARGRPRPAGRSAACLAVVDQLDLLVAGGDVGRRPRSIAVVGTVSEYASGPALMRVEGRADVTASAGGIVVARRRAARAARDAGQLLVRFYERARRAPSSSG